MSTDEPRTNHALSNPAPVGSLDAITPRDLFAAAIMSGWIAIGRACTNQTGFQSKCEQAFSFADAMLAARGK